MAHQLPNAEHWFGTDMYGRDLFVRMAMGARVSLLVAFAATGVVLVVGVLYGSISGFAGGKTDDTMMRFVDILYGLPYLPFAIILLVILGAGIVPMLLALAIVSWLTPSRLVRGQILTLKQNEYVEAARGAGSLALTDHLPPPASQHAGPHRGGHVPGSPRDDPRRGHPFLPGPGHLGPQRLLGDARRGGLEGAALLPLVDHPAGDLHRRPR